MHETSLAEDQPWDVILIPYCLRVDPDHVAATALNLTDLHASEAMSCLVINYQCSRSYSQQTKFDRSPDATGLDTSEVVIISFLEVVKQIVDNDYQVDHDSGEILETYICDILAFSVVDILGESLPYIVLEGVGHEQPEARYHFISSCSHRRQLLGYLFGSHPNIRIHIIWFHMHKGSEQWHRDDGCVCASVTNQTHTHPNSQLFLENIVSSSLDVCLEPFRELLEEGRALPLAWNPIVEEKLDRLEDSLIFFSDFINIDLELSKWLPDLCDQSHPFLPEETTLFLNSLFLMFFEVHEIE